MTTPKDFIREDISSVTEGTIVRYKWKGFEIVASRNGVTSAGIIPTIKSLSEFNLVSKYMTRAFMQYQCLMRFGMAFTEDMIDKVITQSMTKEFENVADN